MPTRSSASRPRLTTAVVALAISGLLPGQHPPGRHPGSETEREREPRKPRDADRPGIPVEDPIVLTHCSRCHAPDRQSRMTRISYLRKSPEGWARTLKRMIRLHGLRISPDDARQVVRSLANSHGLARSEAERGLYESERRTHWSEEERDEDFRRACAPCHPLGRVLLQQRDAEEWQLLRATHVAMFPLSSRQIGGGPPRESSHRAPPPEAAAAMRRGRSGSSRGSSSESRAERGSRENVGDKVLRRLAEEQPLFTDAWRKWRVADRTVPLQDTWTVVGHEVGRGDLFGTAVITRTGEDGYDIRWEMSCTDGSRIERSGRGLLYAGYSWRGRSVEGDRNWREVLLLDESWQTLRGRVFTGSHDELGADVTLYRDRGEPRILAIDHRAIPVPAKGHVLDLWGEAFPEEVETSALHLGTGVAVRAVERVDARHLRATVDVAAGAELGTRPVAYGPRPGTVDLLLYDTVDYLRITPRQGLARVGGLHHPKQFERFEAIAVHRGPDGKPYTDDDVDLFQVRPRWGLEEFKVREGDDDVRYVGSIDPESGLFTPGPDGPNPDRKWSANNVGDVFVTAEVELEVPIRKEDGTEEKKETNERPLEHVRRTFRARSHLIVTIPLYARWAALDWEDR